MHKITISTLLLSFLFLSTNAQTDIFTSNSDSTTGWSYEDIDGDTNNWVQDPSTYNGAYGYTGSVFFSTANSLTPNNLLKSPTFLIPPSLTDLDFEMRIGNAIGTPFTLENYMVYIYDTVVNPTGDYTTATEIMNATANQTSASEIVSADIPSSFSGKTVGLIIRHYNPTGGALGNIIIADDFKVSSPQTLAIGDFEIKNTYFHPNPTKGQTTIQTNANIRSVEIFNQLGQKIITYDKNMLTTQKIDLSEYNRGIYLVVITDYNQNITTKKLIKN